MKASNCNILINCGLRTSTKKFIAMKTSVLSSKKWYEFMQTTNVISWKEKQLCNPKKIDTFLTRPERFRQNLGFKQCIDFQLPAYKGHSFPIQMKDERHRNVGSLWYWIQWCLYRVPTSHLRSSKPIGSNAYPRRVWSSCAGTQVWAFIEYFFETLVPTRFWTVGFFVEFCVERV